MTVFITFADLIAHLAATLRARRKLLILVRILGDREFGTHAAFEDPLLHEASIEHLAQL